MKKYLLSFLISVVLLTSCNEPQKKAKLESFDEESVKEPLVQANQNSVRMEDEDINLYIKRHALNVIRTETGLRYQITKKGAGKTIKSKDKVILDFETYSIAGELLYTSKEEGTKEIEIDKSNEIPALEEALKRMNNRSEAHLVIPSHLAYGVAGDGKKIRQRIPIVMKIKILNVK